MAAWRMDGAAKDLFPHMALQFDVISGGKPLHRHRHENVIEIVLIEEGSFDFVVDATQRTVVSGEAMLSCPWEEHGASQTILTPGRLAWIQIDVGQWQRKGPLRLGDWCGLSRKEQTALGQVLAADHSPFLGKSDAIRDALRRLRRELSVPLPFQTFAVNFLLTDLLVRVARQLQTAPSADRMHERRIDLLRRRIREAPGEHWSIEEMSRAAGISRSCLERRVKAVTGLTPHALLIRERLDRSLELLRESPRDITNIAFELGFSSSSHFSTWFNRTFGLSPDQFRKAITTVPGIRFDQLVRVRELVDKLKADPARPAAEFVVYKAAELSPEDMDRVVMAMTGHTLAGYQHLLQSRKA